MQQQRKNKFNEHKENSNRKLDGGVRLTYGNMVQPLTDREDKKTLDDLRVLTVI